MKQQINNSIRDEPYNELIFDCRHGTFCAPIKDKFITRSLRELGECGEKECSLYKSILRQGDTAIDVGANIGVHAVAMARAVGNAGRVIAFEPDRMNFLCLCANAAINSLFSIMPVNKVVSDLPGQVRLLLQNPWECESSGGFKIEDASSDNGMLVEVVPLDVLNVHPRLIKIDVEHMEPKVMRGMRRLLDRCADNLPYLYTECWSLDDLKEQADTLSGLDYKGYYFEGCCFNKPNWRGVEESDLAEIRSPNVLWVPTEEEQPADLELCVEVSLNPESFSSS